MNRGAARRTRWRMIGGALLVAAGAWSGGFAWFLHATARPAALPARADGIVALTGGAERVRTAIRLLTENRGPVLLISGVPHGMTLPILAHRLQFDPAEVAGRVTLGDRATSTRGNALETATWARREGLHSLIVVTAAYHMPRAMTELRSTMPEVRLYPAPVSPPPRPGTNDSGTLGMLATEYTKWLAAQIGLGRLSRGQDWAFFG